MSAPRYATRSLVLLAALAAGCATHADRLRQVRQDYYTGNLELASAKIEKEITAGKNDADVLKLDGAIVDLAAGRTQRAESSLRQVRDSFDHLEQKSVAESAVAMLTDDNARSYAGEDYEKVLIRAFLALSNLMHDGGDAEAYALQVADKQEQIIRQGTGDKENLKLSYKRVALGAYLCGALREETHSRYDDVSRSYAMVCSWQPDFPFAQQDLQRAQHGHHSARGNGVLYVFALTGRGPYKEQAEEIPSTVSMLIADRIISATSKHTLPPTVAPIKVPKVVVRQNRVQTVEVLAEGQFAGRTATITDVSRLAAEQYTAIYPHVIARAVVRRAVKKGIVYGAKEAIGVQNNSVANLALDLGGVAWEAMESADTRCWGLLPDKIQVLRLELPAGEHRIGLRAAGGGFPGREDETTVSIADGRNTYLLASFPDDHMVGQITQSRGR